MVNVFLEKTNFSQNRQVMYHIFRIMVVALTVIQFMLDFNWECDSSQINKIHNILFSSRNNHCSTSQLVFEPWALNIIWKYHLLLKTF